MIQYYHAYDTEDNGNTIKNNNVTQLNNKKKNNCNRVRHLLWLLTIWWSTAEGFSVVRLPGRLFQRHDRRNVLLNGCQSPLDFAIDSICKSLHHDDENNNNSVPMAIVRKGMKDGAILPFPKNGDIGEFVRAADDNDESSEWEKVNGCMSTVYLRTTASSSSRRVKVDGTADALLSRGLVAIVSSLASYPNVTAGCILNMDGSTLARRLHIDTALTQGRNDGLHHMWTLVQHQLQSLLHTHHTNNNNNNNNNTILTTTTTTHHEEEEGKPRVAMLLSGGVDSAVALNVLLRSGRYRVTCFYLKIWLEEELAHLGHCPWEDDIRMCRTLCDMAGVSLETVSLQRQYQELVSITTIREARRGRTPNPDILCNARIKFGCFYEHVIHRRNFDHIATGHYAQLIDGTLFRSPDPIKDQSYFLSALTRTQLSKVLFPIGHFHKTTVRELAHQFRLPNKDRPDSQGLCFLGKMKFDDFVLARLHTNPGDIVEIASGTVIGRHNGLWFHTIGQRKGLGNVLDPKLTWDGPWFVVAKHVIRNILFVSNHPRQEDALWSRARKEFHVEHLHWISGDPPIIDGTRMDMKIRHGPSIVQGTLHLNEDDDDDENTTNGGHILLEEMDHGLAPGQYVAFYRDMECLGCGVISEHHWNQFIRSFEEKQQQQQQLLLS